MAWLCCRTLFVCVIVSAAAPAFAQRASVAGTATDQSGAVLPGVNVTSLNLDQGLKRETITNALGYFSLPLLSPGRYSLMAQLQGFAPYEVKDLVLNVGDDLILSIRMELAKVGESVTVTAEPPRINASPAVSTVIDRQFVENLPLNGRSFQSLLALTPGVVLTNASAEDKGQFSVNGQRADANYFTVDGVSANLGVNPNNLGQSGGGSLPAFGITGGTNNLVSVDAVQEFRVLTSTYSAEFGRSPGGQMSLVTRSGTNVLHGTAFDYFRNDALDATDWFTNANGLTKPALRQNDFGGVTGGPIIKNRTFFFGSYEGLRLRQPQSTSVDVPSLSTRQAAPAQLRPFLSAFPQPNGPTTVNGVARFSASYSVPSTLDATSLRIDHEVSGSTRVFGRYNESPSETASRGGGTFSLNTLSETRFRTRTLTGGLTQIGRAMSNELRLNVSTQTGATTFSVDTFGDAVVPSTSSLFPSFVSPDVNLFSFSVTGVSSYRIGLNANNSIRQVNVVDKLSFVKGQHSATAGVDYRRINADSVQRNYTLGATFSGIGTGAAPAPGSVLSGTASSVAIAAIDPLTLMFNNLSAFAQDSWRASPRLTINTGVRWEVNPAPDGGGGNPLYTIQNIDTPASFALAAKGTPLFHTEHANLAPRADAAYQISGAAGRETVIRAGYGLFYDLVTGAAADAAISFPYLRSRVITNVVYPVADQNILSPPPFSVTPLGSNMLGVFDPDLSLPRTHEWNVSLERALSSHETLSISYVGAAGRQLLRREQYFNPNPAFATVQITRNTATSDYRALQFQYRRRLSAGFQALASYTWSQSVDIASTDAASTGTHIDPNVDRGPSDFDVRHAMNAAVIYQLPIRSSVKVIDALVHGWSIDGIVNARSALPVNVFSSRNIGDGVLRTRPDLVPDVALSIDDPTAPGGFRINKNAFVIPSALRQGNLERNALRGFPFSQVDVALRRQIPMFREASVEISAEAFNVLNHPNFANPVSSLTSGQFGVATSSLAPSLGSGGFGGGYNPLYQVGGPRSIQLAAKLRF